MYIDEPMALARRLFYPGRPPRGARASIIGPPPVTHTARKINTIILLELIYAESLSPAVTVLLKSLAATLFPDTGVEPNNK